MYGKWKAILENADLFQGIPVDETIHLLECLWPRLEMYAKDEFAILTGDEVRGCGLVLSGQMEVIKENALGQQMILTVVGPGEMFGEVAAFSGAKFWPASVRVREEAVVVYLTAEQVLGLCEQGCFSHRQMMVNMMKILAEKAMVLNRKVEYLSIKSLRGKVCALLYEHYQRSKSLNFQIKMNRSEMAEYLNIPRPSLSRELGGLRDEGILSFDRSAFTIHDLEQMKGFLV